MPMPRRSQKQAEIKLVLALACGATVETAALQSGLSVRTVYLRLKDPEFRRRIAEVSSDTVRRTTGALTAAAMQSVQTLLELLKPNYPGNVRLGAARTVLELGLKFREETDLREQITEVKELLINGKTSSAVPSLPTPGVPDGDGEAAEREPTQEPDLSGGNDQ
jgi:hypothetical protein